MSANNTSAGVSTRGVSGWVWLIVLALPLAVFAFGSYKSYTANRAEAATRVVMAQQATEALARTPAKLVVGCAVKNGDEPDYVRLEKEFASGARMVDVTVSPTEAKDCLSDVLVRPQNAPDFRTEPLRVKRVWSLRTWSDSSRDSEEFLETPTRWVAPAGSEQEKKFRKGLRVVGRQFRNEGSTPALVRIHFYK